jgi:4-hydroxybenzoate polyprenyltransferase
MILAGKSGDPAAWIAGLGAFVAMGAVASATYLVNDLTDIEDDRRHPAKRLRPLASGELPLKAAIGAAPLLLAAGFALAGLVAGLAGVLALAGYTAGTLAYSLRLKRVPIMDVMLLVLCMFAFASLALSKRAAEIGRCAAAGADMPGGRGYRLADAPFVSGLGAATAVASVLVLVLYLVNDAMPVGLYARPAMLWGAPVALSLWFGRIWLLCGRGELHEDPVAFAVRDRVSLALGAATLASVALARIPL